MTNDFQEQLITSYNLTLLQILLNSFGFADKKRDMQVGRFHEALDGQHGLVEFLRKLLMVLIAPGVAQCHELAVQDGDAALKIIVELLQIMGKPAKFFRIDNGMRHAKSSGC